MKKNMGRLSNWRLSQTASLTNPRVNTAARQQVEMYERKWLLKNLKEYPVTWQDVNKCQFYTN